MQVYLVGGALRNELLGLEVKDRDWVVVGATPEELLRQGYQQVGKSFPVFLHPQTKEEYALARTERKTGPGYTGFSVNAAPQVTLEEDLQRRDLTINAIARDTEGNWRDPYHGREDLEARILRHVSTAFAEDPVRILRAARLCAQLGAYDFTVAAETLTLMRKMVDNGEINALVPERVWKETEKALQSNFPQRYFETLREVGALAVLFPELEALYGVPQNPEFHPEIDCGIHTMMVLTQAARLTPDPQVKFAALVHDLGKATTDKALWPKHPQHEESGVPLVEALCLRYKIPHQYCSLAVIVTRYHLYYHRIAELSADDVLYLFNHLDLFRRPQRFQQYLFACEADSRGRLGYEELDCAQSAILQGLYDAATSVSAADIDHTRYQGAEFGAALAQARIRAIAKKQS